MDSNKTIKKLFATLTLSCGLMTSGLMAAEVSFLSMGQSYSDDGKNYVVVKLLKEGDKKYVFDIDSELRTMRAELEFPSPLITKKLGEKEPEVGDFICANQTFLVLDNLNYKYNEYDKTRAEDKETQRALDKFFRNENDYTLWHRGGRPEYDFVKSFNLAQKIQYTGKYELDWLRISDLGSIAGGYSTNIPEDIGLKDIDALIKIYDEYVEFVKTKAKELVAIETNHAQQVLESTCAPIQKVKKGEDEYGDFSYRITFDENKIIKRIEDLDPAKVLKFIPQEVLQYIKR